MENTETIQADHQLDRGFNLLHDESARWLNRITAWKHEIASMILHAENIRTSSKPLEAQIHKTVGGFRLLDELLDKLHKDISQHKHYLFKLLKSPHPDEQKYRELHQALQARLSAEENHFYTLRREMVKMGEAADHPYPDVNPVMRSIYQRRAVRKYGQKKPAHALIEEIISAGRMAPSAMNLQPWKFIVTENSKKIAAFSASILQIAGNFFGLLHSKSGSVHADPIFHEAPVVIFLAGPKENEWTGLDLGMCAQNMMLAAHSLGLDTCPVGFGALIGQTPHLEEFGLSKNEKIHLAITLGYGAETPELHPRRTDNVTYL